MPTTIFFGDSWINSIKTENEYLKAFEEAATARAAR
jgi:hypothetical protein